MINLKKEEKSTKSFSFSEKDFANIKWQNLKENKQMKDFCKVLTLIRKWVSPADNFCYKPSDFIDD